MSTTIDNSIVSMEFDNSRFERNVAKTLNSLDKLKNKMDFKKSEKGLKALDKTASKFSMDTIVASVESVTKQFSAMEIAATTALVNMTNSVVNAGKRLVSSLTIDQVTAGWDKYADKTTSVQTILAAVSEKGQDINDVTAALERLNWFTDETSYSFTDMVNNIGKFTSQGIDLDKAVTAMQGISTWAAISGQSTNEAARAMYNLSQAIGVGAVKAIDWKSIENASMSTEQFKKQVLETAVAMGTLADAGDGTYKVIKNAVADTEDELGEGLFRIGDAVAYASDSASKAEVTVTNFTQTLSQGWFTSDVLVATLEKYGSYANGIYEIAKRSSKSTSEIMEDVRNLAAGMDISEIADEYSEDLLPMLQQMSEQVGSIGEKALNASQEAKTFAEVINSVKDAVSTGWMNTFEKIFGNYEEAKVFWTDLANEMWDVFAGGAKARNALLDEWRVIEEGGRNDLIDSFWNVFYAIQAVSETIKDAFADIFPPKTAEDLAKGVKAFKNFTDSLMISEKAADTLSKTFKVLFATVDIGLDFLYSLVSVVIHNLSPALGTVDSVLDKVVDKVSGVVFKVRDWEKENTVFERTLNNVVDALKDIYHTIEDSYHEVFDNGELKTSSNLLDRVLNKLNKAIDKIAVSDEFLSTVSTISTLIFTISKNVSGSLYAGMAKVAKKVYSFLKDSGLLTKVMTIIERSTVTIAKIIEKTFDIILKILDKLIDSGVLETVILGIVNGLARLLEIVDAVVSVVSESNFIETTLMTICGIVITLGSIIWKVFSVAFGLVSGFFSLFENHKESALDIINPDAPGGKKFYKETAENVDEIKVAFKGAQTNADRLRLVLTKIKGSLDKVLASLKKTKISETFAGAYEKGRAFKAKLDEIASSIKNRVTKVKNWVATIVNNIKKGVGNVANFITSKWNKLKATLAPSNIGRAISEMVSNFTSVFKTSKLAEDGDEEATTFLDKIKNTWAKILEFIMVSKEELKAFYDFADDDNIFAKIGKVFKKHWEEDFLPVVEKIQSWFNGQGLGWLSKILAFMISFKALAGIWEGARDLIDPLKPLKEFFEGMADLIDAVRKRMLFSIITDAIKSFAFLILSVGVLMIAIHKYPPEEVEKSFIMVSGMIGGIVTALGGIAISMTAINSKVKMITKEDLTLASVAGLFAGMALALGAILVSILGLVLVFKYIDKDGTLVEKSTKTITKMLGDFSVCIGGLMALSAAAKPKALLAAAVMLLALAHTIKTMILPIGLLAILPKDKVEYGIKLFAGIMGFLSLVIAGLMLITKKATMPMAAVIASILGLTLSVDLLLAPILILHKVKWETLLDGLAKVGLVGVIVAGLMKCLVLAQNGIGNGGKVALASVALLAMAAALNAMLIPVFLLGKMDTQTAIQGIAALGVITLFFDGMALALGAAVKMNTFANGTQIVAIAGALVAFTLCIVAISGIAYLLGQMNQDELLGGLKDIALVAGVLSAAMIALAVAGKVGVAGLWAAVGAITVFGIVIGGLYYVLTNYAGEGNGKGIALMILEIVGAFGAFAAIAAILSPASTAILITAAAFFGFAVTIDYFIGTMDDFVRTIDDFKDSITWLEDEKAQSAVSTFADLLKGLGSITFTTFIEKKLVTFAKSLKDSAGDFSKFVGSMSDISIGTAKEAVEIIKLMAETTKIVTGISYNYGGAQTLSEFAGAMSSTGENIKKFIDSVSGIAVGTGENDTQTLCNIVQQLSETGKTLNGTGGLWQKIIGEKSIASFAAEINSAGEDITKFVTKAREFKDDDVDATKRMCKIITVMANETKNMPTDPSSWLGKIFGQYSLSEFSKEMASATTNLGNLLRCNRVMKPASEDIEYAKNVSKIVGAMSSVADELGDNPEARWKVIRGIFGQDYTLSEFAKQIADTSEPLEKFISKLNTLKPTLKNVTQTKYLVSIIGAMSGVADELGMNYEDRWTVLNALFGQKYTLSQFANDMAGSIASLQTFIEEVNKGTVLDENRLNDVVAAVEAAIGLTEQINGFTYYGGMQTLEDIAKNMRLASNDLVIFFNNMDAVNDDELTKGSRVFSSLSVLIASAAGLKSYSAADKLIKDIPTIAANMSKFYKSIAGLSVDTAAFNNVTAVMIDIIDLAKKADEIKNVYNLSNVMSDATGFGKHVKKYVESISGLNAYSNTIAMEISREVLALAKEVATDATWTSSLFKNADLVSFGVDMEEFGSSVSNFVAYLTDYGDKESIESAKEILNSVLGLTEGMNRMIASVVTSVENDIEDSKSPVIRLASLMATTFVANFASNEHLTNASLAGRKFIDSIADGIKSHFTSSADGTATLNHGKVKSALTSFVNAVCNELNNLTDKFVSAGEAAGEAFARGFNNSAGEVLDYTSGNSFSSDSLNFELNMPDATKMLENTKSSSPGIGLNDVAEFLGDIIGSSGTTSSSVNNSKNINYVVNQTNISPKPIDDVATYKNTKKAALDVAYAMAYASV